MTSVRIKLEDDLKQRLSVRAAENGFETVEEYLEALARSDAAEEQLVDDDIEELLLRRLEHETELEVTADFVRQFRKEVGQRRRERARSRKRGRNG